MLPLSLLMFALHSSTFTHSDVGTKQPWAVSRCPQFVAVMLNHFQHHEIKIKASKNP